MAKRKTCGDCGTKEGQLHILGCDMERCPFCGNQLIACQCGYKKLGIDVSPGSWAYSHGLTEAQQKDWEKLLSDKGRIPFILYPNLCAKCGTLWPEMFVVPDAEWKHYIEPQMRREMLCEACYKQIKAWIDGEGLGADASAQTNKAARISSRRLEANNHFGGRLRALAGPGNGRMANAERGGGGQ